jgi:hypothetical protein
MLLLRYCLPVFFAFAARIALLRRVLWDVFTLWSFWSVCEPVRGHSKTTSSTYLLINAAKVSRLGLFSGVLLLSRSLKPWWLSSAEQQ